MMLHRFDLQSDDDIKRMVDVNLWGVVNGIKAVRDTIIDLALIQLLYDSHDPSLIRSSSACMSARMVPL